MREAVGDQQHRHGEDKKRAPHGRHHLPGFIAGIVALLALVQSACATAPPPGDVRPAPSAVERWQRDLDAYGERRERFEADVPKLREDFVALAAEASFPPLEDRLAGLAARVRAGEVERPQDALVATLWTMSLGELMLFPRLLALSTEVVKLEAVYAELESLRLDLAVRRLGLTPGTAPGMELIHRPLWPPFACARYPIGRLELVRCR